MKVSELFEAVDYSAQVKAGQEIIDIFKRTFNSWYKNEKPKPKKIKDEEIPEILKRVKELLKITGRAHKNYGYVFTMGYMYDDIVTDLRKRLSDSGAEKIFPDNKSTTGFAKELAAYYGGRYSNRTPRKWTSSLGGSYSDPSDYVVFNNEQDLDSAWDDLQTKGKKVYIKDSPSSSPRTYTQIGSLLIAPNSVTYGAFSDSPETESRLSVQTTKILKNWLRKKEEITDQQAASLQDIAATRNATAMEKIKLIISLFKGEEDVKAIIDNSKKITAKDKAKLDKIIDDAKNFKE